MNNPAVNQALIELEENLSNIESARNQINKVAEKSEQLIKAFNKVLETINSADTHITIDENAIKQYLEGSFTTFKTDLSKIVKESASSVKGLQSGISDHVSLFENFVKQASEVTDTQMNGYLKKLQINFDEKNERLSNSTSKILDSVQGLRNSINNETITKKLNQDLDNIQLCIKDLIKRSEDSIKHLETALINSDKSFFTALKTAMDKVDSQLKDVMTGLKSELEMTVTFIQAEMNVFIAQSKNVNDQMLVFESTLKILDKKILELDFESRFKEIVLKIDTNNEQTHSIENSIIALDKKIEVINYKSEVDKLIEKVEANSNRTQSLENYILSLEKKIDGLEIHNNIIKIENKINSNHKQLLIVGIVIILGLVVLAFLP